MKEWLKAWRNDFIWPFCRWCFWRLLWADDVGFMYLHPFPSYIYDSNGRITGNTNDKRNNRPCCKHCYFGLPGTAHTLRHGVGER